MQAPSHAGFAVAGAAIANTALYHFNINVPDPYNDILHEIGQPFNLTQWQFLIRSGLLWQQPLLGNIAWKVLFYILLVRFSYAPNKLEAPSGGKRGPLHSCCAVVVIGVALIGGYFILLFRNPYDVRPFLASAFIQHTIFTAMLALLMALALHILADAITKDGVPAFSPLSSGKVGIPIVTATKPSEHVAIYIIIFVTGILFTQGIVGF